MKTGTILVADDDRGIRTVLDHALGREGHAVKLAANASTLWKWVEAGEGDLVITDVIMPDENGLDLIPRIKKIRPELPIIVMSAQNTLLTAIKANERGAYEYLPKPFDLKELSTVIQRALNTPKASVNANNPAEVEENMPLIGRSSAMQEIYRHLAKLMTNDLTVMITGESGTGKELVARALHNFGKRRNGPFVALNMAAIPRELIESELFGHEKGAFTGANARSVGRFEQAQGGTLFLDEIGDMPLEAQTRLLRVLQEGEYSSVGGRKAISADVRIVAATHRDLKLAIHQGSFREDLYYRLNVVPLRLPPLRERVEDIPDLVRHFFKQASEQGLPYKSLDNPAIERMKLHRWPGNIRELENLVRRLAALYADDVIGIEVIDSELSETLSSARTQKADSNDFTGESLSDSVDRHVRKYFADHGDQLPPAGVYDRILREVEKPLIELALVATRGNQIKCASLLGLNRNTLRKKIRDLDVEVVRSLK